jgi:sodium-dependent dicarboxylate transporter 2/3/5
VPLVLFPLVGVAPIEDAAGPYASPVIFLFLGGFVIAAALEECGLHRRMAVGIIRLAGTRPASIVGGFMAATAFISMWVSNTATVVMLLPMALSLIDWRDSRLDAPDAPAFARALLLGLAYAASIGGIGTLIGTPPNALLAGFLSETYGIELGFLQWMMFGVPLVVVSLPLAWLLLTRGLRRVPAARAGSDDAEGPGFGSAGRMRPAEWLVGTITALTAAAWLTRPLLERAMPGLSDAGIAVAGALLLFVIPVSWRRWEWPLRWERVERLPWGVLILFGGGLALAQAIQQTGLAAWLGTRMHGLAALPPLLIAAAVVATVIFLSELASNTSVAAVFLPIVASLAVTLGESPLIFSVCTAVAASTAFMLPVGTPPNALVYASGRVTAREMARAGLALNLLFIVLVTVAAWLLGPVVFGR